MVEDRCSISFAKNSCYVGLHISFILCDENGCKTNSVLYFKIVFARISQDFAPFEVLCIIFYILYYLLEWKRASTANDNHSFISVPLLILHVSCAL